MIKSYRELPPEAQKTASFLWDKLVRSKVMVDKDTLRKPDFKQPQKPKQGKGRMIISFFPLLLP